MMQKIRISETINLDESPELSEDELKCNVMKHQYDVCRVLLLISNHINHRAINHDWTKDIYFDDFRKDVNERKTGKSFKNRDWYNIHTSLERHHITAKELDDINLIDILEYIVDCVVTGESRCDGVDKSFLKLNQDLLLKAYTNTIDFVINTIEK